MSGLYIVEAVDWLRSVGLTVHLVADWETRARSSGGFPHMPWGVQFHHTASRADPEDDAAYMFHNSPDAPVGNMLLARTGEVWLGAAGAANTAGKGGPLTLSRGTVPVDGANSRTWAIEAANDGVGEPWPAVQIDAYFTASNELNRRFGNLPSDIFNHASWTWQDHRKIDPATATAVQGSWRPASSNSSGTWDQSDVTAEATRRAGGQTPEPAPTPTPPEGDDMAAPATTIDADGDPWAVFLIADGTLNAKHADDPPFSLGGPGQPLTSGISIVNGPTGNLYVWAYAVDGSTWLRHWPGPGKEWDPWFHAG